MSNAPSAPHCIPDRVRASRNEPPCPGACASRRATARTPALPTTTPSPPPLAAPPNMDHGPRTVLPMYGLYPEQTFDELCADNWLLFRIQATDANTLYGAGDGLVASAHSAAAEGHREEAARTFDWGGEGTRGAALAHVRRRPGVNVPGYGVPSPFVSATFCLAWALWWSTLRNMPPGHTRLLIIDSFALRGRARLGVQVLAAPAGVGMVDSGEFYRVRMAQEALIPVHVPRTAILGTVSVGALRRFAPPWLRPSALNTNGRDNAGAWAPPSFREVCDNIRLPALGDEDMRNASLRFAFGLLAPSLVRSHRVEIGAQYICALAADIWRWPARLKPQGVYPRDEAGEQHWSLEECRAACTEPARATLQVYADAITTMQAGEQGGSWVSKFETDILVQVLNRHLPVAHLGADEGGALTEWSDLQSQLSSI
ncbi:hypothetical protein BC834DRAFT_566770 [Gloeopeniophorella convolvens]|nr:hypothetical protein BC834DRAFT_566770 [Gloeopeniophorella convolvens]